MPSATSAFVLYRDFYRKIKDLENISSLLHWDSETYIPRDAREERGRQISLLSSMVHEWQTGAEFDKLIAEAKEESHRLPEEERNLREREFQVLEIQRAKAKKLPTEFVTEMAETTNSAHALWAEAKSGKGFAHFFPILEKIVTLSKKQADYLGYTNEPYDALLDSYEKGATADSIAALFSSLKKDLIPLVKEAPRFSNPFTKPIPVASQEFFCRRIPEWLGLKITEARLDISNHPFSTSLGSKDKRITTRYSESDPMSSVFGVLHECGHALYERGLSEIADSPTPLTEFLSLGIHESQSRLWENQVGRSKAFWTFAYPILLKDFSLSEKELPFEDLFRYLNSTQRSKIRVEADQLTYNLHIILRFEIERDLVNGKIQTKDLPQIWNEKMKHYLDLEIHSDAEGVLQDIHWAMGAFGYFPTYALGNIFGAQLFSAFLQKNPDFPENLAKHGETQALLNWLKINVHHKGKILEVNDLIFQATGENPNHSFLIETLKTNLSNL